MGLLDVYSPVKDNHCFCIIVLLCQAPTKDHQPDQRGVALSAWLLGVSLFAPVARWMVLVIKRLLQSSEPGDIKRFGGCGPPVDKKVYCNDVRVLHRNLS